MASRFDQIYRSVLLTKFFSNGWGKPENLKRILAFRKLLSNREKCMSLVNSQHPITLTKEVEYSDYFVFDAEFTSPMVDHMPGLIPKECEKASFQLILPKCWKSTLKPTCLHLAGTGDHGFQRRKLGMGKPLVQEYGIASIILENPFYGSRKPSNQWGSGLRNVSDLFIMGGCLVLESLAIFHWAERHGLGPLGVTGISMGGHMASLAACSWDKAIPLIPCLSWSTASGVFTQGVLSGAVKWNALKHQYFSDTVFRDELFNMIRSPEGHFRVCHDAGQKFAKNFPKSLDQIEKLKSEKKKIDAEETFDAINATNGQKFNIKKLWNNVKLTKIREPLRQSSLLLKYRKDKSNISSPSERHFPSVEIRGASPDRETSPVEFKPYFSVNDSLTWEALQFMRGIMDECTHLGNFSPPVDPSLVIIVSANEDAYMPLDGVIPLTKLWPEAEHRIINSGHIAAFLLYQMVFRKAIKDAFDRTIDKYHSKNLQSKMQKQPSLIRN